jgi:site-specific recombinase XerD
LNRLSDRAVDLIVKGACRAAHLKESYSAHSLRAGHVTEALARGADRAAIKRQTGHASDAMLDRYARETDLAANNSSSSPRALTLARATRAYRRGRRSQTYGCGECCLV